MNDCHDAFGMPYGKLVYPLKIEHPELLLGDPSQRGEPQDGLVAAMWSGLDFADEKVRQDRIRWVEHAAKSYDLDGVDLNFFRMPWYFKLGEEEKNMPLMTDFIRQSRQRLDKISHQRGRPVLLGVRVPGTVETCNRIGLDIETWLREGLVDRMLTGGGYVCFSTPAEELVRLGHRHEVPVYPCINCPAIYELSNENLRAAASNLWWAGADGIYLWNFHYIPAPGKLGYGRPAHELFHKLLPEIAAPERLKYLDKSFAVNSRVWEQYQRASALPPLPVDLGTKASEKAQSIPIRIGDDVPGAVRSGKLHDATLQLKPSGAARGDALAVSFNGAKAETTVGDSNGWLAVPLPARAITQGVNRLELHIVRHGESASESIVIDQVRVDVRYRG